MSKETTHIQTKNQVDLAAVEDLWHEDETPPQWRGVMPRLIRELRASRKVVEAARRQVADMETAHDLGETFPLNVALSTNALEEALAEL